VARASKPLTEGRSAVRAILLYLWAWVFANVSWAKAIVSMPTRPRAAADTIAIHLFLIAGFSERRKSPSEGRLSREAAYSQYRQKLPNQSSDVSRFTSAGRAPSTRLSWSPGARRRGASEYDFLRHRTARYFNRLPRQGPVSADCSRPTWGNSWRVLR
jgi:hypothetical protein